MNKLKAIKNIALVAGLAFSTYSCVDNQDLKIPSIEGAECSSKEANSTLSAVLDQAGKEAKMITDDLSFTGYVISSDEGGNFYKTLVLQNEASDATAGVEISVDLKDYYDYFPLGTKVIVDAKDLYIAEDNGVIKLGGEKEDKYLKRLDPKFFLTHVKRVCGDNETVKPKVFTSIKEATKTAGINTLIRLEGVQFKDADGKATYYNSKNSIGGATNIVIQDKEGNTLDLRNGQYVDWAKKVLPKGSGSITVVLSKYGKSYQSYINSLEDVKLDKERFNVDKGGDAPMLNAAQATIADFKIGEKVKLHGKITVENNRSYFIFSDGTKIQMYSKAFGSFPQDIKDKLNTNQQEVTVIGEFGEYNGTKQISYNSADDLVFGKTPGGGVGPTPVAGKMFDFENLTGTPSNSYSTAGTLTAQDGTVLNFKARTDLDGYGIDGKGLMIQKDKGYIKITFKNGVKKVKFAYKGAYTNQSERKVVVYEGGEDSTTEIGSKSFAYNEQGEYELPLNKTGEYTITIKAADKQVVIDNIAWEDNSGGGTPVTGGGSFDFASLEKPLTSFNSKGSLTVENGSTLEIQGRTANIPDDYKIGDNCAMVRETEGCFITITFKGGVGALTFDYKGAYNKGKDRKFVIYEGDKDSTKKIGETESFSDYEVKNFKLPLNEEEDYTITIKEEGIPSGVIGNIAWSKYSADGGNPAAGKIDFNDLKKGKGDGTFTVADGDVEVSYKGTVMDTEDYKIDANGLFMKKPLGDFITMKFKTGVKKLSFQYRRYYTSNPRELIVYLNGKEIDKIDFDDQEVHTYEKDLNESGEATVTIKAGEKPIIIDDITWTK